MATPTDATLLEQGEDGAGRLWKYYLISVVAGAALEQTKISTAWPSCTVVSYRAVSDQNIQPALLRTEAIVTPGNTYFQTQTASADVTNAERVPIVALADPPNSVLGEFVHDLAASVNPVTAACFILVVEGLD